MDFKKKAGQALLSVFPSEETFMNVSSNSENDSFIQSFIKFAFDEKLIAECNHKAFQNFIGIHTANSTENILPENITMEQFFENKQEFLNIEFSVRGLCIKINSLIKRKKIDLPQVSNTMLTRLKKEPADTSRKRNALRALAFWIGFERPEKCVPWNYETLRGICTEIKQTTHFKEGVRIAFSLHSRGDVIGHDTINWLKKSIKSHIKKNINNFLVGTWGRVKSHDITTLFVDFPKETSIIDPSSYHKSILFAISAAHELAVKWALSDYCTQNRFLAIGIDAGNFATIDTRLIPILSAKLPGDPVIRLTDFTRQCALINDIRAIFCKTPKEIELYTGEKLNIWWIEGLWSTIYWGFIPELLKNIPDIDNHHNSQKRISNSLSPLTNATRHSNKLANTIKQFLKFPQNTLFGIEVAKTLYYRKKFWEADEVLRILLSIRPDTLNARLLRMTIYRNLAIEISSFQASEILYTRAENEAVYIEQHTTSTYEDYYDEYAVIKLTKALTYLNIVRKNKGSFTYPDGKITPEDIFLLIEEAENLFFKGAAVSPTGYRTIYLIGCTRIIKRILKLDPSLFTDENKKISCPPAYITEICRDLFLSIGWIHEDKSYGINFHDLYQSIENAFQIHHDSVLLDAYRPTILFCMAVVFWDFFPVKTVAVVKKVLISLDKAISIAVDMGKQNICIYSYSRCRGEIMPADIFISHMEKAVHLIETSCCSLEDLNGREDTEIVPIEDNDFFLLLTLNF